jgi:hypothetical protein
MDVVTGDEVRDWQIHSATRAWFPYRDERLLTANELGGALRALWAWRTSAWERRTFAKQSYKEEGRPFYEWHQVALHRHRSPLALTWGEVTSHNHFSLGKGGQVFNRTAPIIKLPDFATELDYLGLAAVLNSSTACFWLRQVCQEKPGYDEPFDARVAFNASNVGDVPLPRDRPTGLAARLNALGKEREGLLDDLANHTRRTSLRQHLADVRERDAQLAGRMTSLQEELDWQILGSFGLNPAALPLSGEGAPPIRLGQRAFEIVLARRLAAGEVETTWFDRHGSQPIVEVPRDWPAAYRAVVEQRVALIEADADIAMIERPEHKRRWNQEPWENRQREVLVRLVLDALEADHIWAGIRLHSTSELTDMLRANSALVEALEILADRKDTDLASTIRRLVLDDAVPHLVAQRLTDKGLRKREVWEHVWDLQRAEDRREDVGSIPVPPKYAPADFRSSTTWKHRGKLDVPKERFVLVSHAERGADTSPVVGWAGWDQRDLARALAGRIMELREQEAADSERLTPLLAGVLELLPWIHQWYPNSDPVYGGTPGQYFEGWVDGQLAELAITRDTLRTWRPPAPTRGRKAKAGAA